MKNLTKAKFVLAISLIGLIGIPRTEAKPYGKLLKDELDKFELLLLRIL